MRPFPDLDLSSAVIGSSGIIHTQGANANEQMMVYNDSLFRLQLTFSDGRVEIIPPSWNKDIVIPDVPLADVSWLIVDAITAKNYPSTKLYGIVYEDGEHVASVNAGMQRGFQITGGGVSSSQVVNTGATDGTVLLESSDNAFPSSIVNYLTTDGLGQFLGYSNNSASPVRAIQMGGSASSPLGNPPASDLYLGKVLGDNLAKYIISVIGEMWVQGSIGFSGNKNNFVSTGNIAGLVNAYMVLSGYPTLMYLDFKGYNCNTTRSIPLSNYQNATGFTTGLIALAGAIGPLNDGGVVLLKNGGVVTGQVLTSLSSSGGGVTNSAYINQNSVVFYNNPVDQIVLEPTTGPHTGQLILLGV